MSHLLCGSVRAWFSVCCSGVLRRVVGGCGVMLVLLTGDRGGLLAQVWRTGDGECVGVVADQTKCACSLAWPPRPARKSRNPTQTKSPPFSSRQQCHHHNTGAAARVGSRKNMHARGRKSMHARLPGLFARRLSEQGGAGLGAAEASTRWRCRRTATCCTRVRATGHWWRTTFAVTTAYCTSTAPRP